MLLSRKARAQSPKAVTLEGDRVSGGVRAMAKRYRSPPTSPWWDR